MSYTIIDRRLNPGGKSLSNRQRFMKRAKEFIKKSVKDGLLDRSITSTDDHNVTIPPGSTKEPWFHHDGETGSKDYVLPGNSDFVPGDLIEKPPQGQGGGKNASEDGEGEDGFTFPITRDEFNELLFDDLELPNLKKKSLKESISFVKSRTGYVNDGTPCNLDLTKSMRNSLGRRISLKKPKLKKIKQLEEELAILNSIVDKTQLQKTRLAIVEAEIKKLQKKVDAITFLDPLDLRYRNFEKKPVPKHRAVMFCVMDVSGSMGDHEKELAKRFYLLLYLFLEYKYEIVNIVFIRHHSTAQECNEEDFFYNRESGGTVVSTGFEEMMRVQKERYPEDEWNIYVAQASDGDNFSTDDEKLSTILTEQVFPISQFFAYIEVSEDEESKPYWKSDDNTGLWPLYRQLRTEHKNMEMRKADSPEHVYQVFFDLFKKEQLPSE